VDENRSAPFYVLIAAVALAVIVGGVLLFTRPGLRPPPAPPPLSDEQKTYLPYLVVRNARLSAAENFLGNTVTYLDAELSNQGNRTVRQVELELVFVDTLNQVVLRETARPVTPRTAPLAPGETRAFQISFDHLPVEWNRAAPAITPLHVGF
jgi:hypothetical protein